MKKNKQLLSIMSDMPEEFVTESDPSVNENVTVRKRISVKKTVTAAACITLLLGLQYRFLIKPLEEINQRNSGNSSTEKSYTTASDKEKTETDKSSAEKDYPRVQKKKLYNGDGIFRPTEICDDGTIFGILSIADDEEYYLEIVLPGEEKNHIITVILDEIRLASNIIKDCDICYNDDIIYLFVNDTVYSVENDSKHKLISKLGGFGSDTDLMGIDRSGNIYMRSAVNGEAKKLVKFDSKLDILKEYDLPSEKGYRYFKEVQGFDDMYSDGDNIFCVYGSGNTAEFSEDGKITAEHNVTDNTLNISGGYMYIENDEGENMLTAFFGNNDDDTKGSTAQCIYGNVQFCTVLGFRTVLAGVGQDGYIAFDQELRYNVFDGLLSPMCQKYVNNMTYLLETDGKLEGDYENINDHIFIRCFKLQDYYELRKFSDFETEKFYPNFSNIEATENGDFYITAFCNETISDESELLSLKSLGYCKFYKYDSKKNKVISLKFDYENSSDEDISIASGKIFMADEKLYCIMALQSNSGDEMSFRTLCYRVDIEKGECSKVPLPENMTEKFFTQRDGTVSYIADNALYSYSAKSGEAKKIFDLNDYYALADTVLKLNDFEYIVHSTFSSNSAEYDILTKNAQANAGEEFIYKTDRLENIISMYITEESNAGTGVSIAVLNTSDKKVCCGQDYRVQVERDGKWYLLEPWTNDPDEPVFGFTSEAILCKKEEPVTFTLNWTYFYGGALPEGHYRVCKPFTVYDFGEDGEPFYLTAEFYVKDEKITVPAFSTVPAFR